MDWWFNKKTCGFLFLNGISISVKLTWSFMVLLLSEKYLQGTFSYERATSMLHTGLGSFCIHGEISLVTGVVKWWQYSWLNIQITRRDVSDKSVNKVKDFYNQSLDFHSNDKAENREKFLKGELSWQTTSTNKHFTGMLWYCFAAGCWVTPLDVHSATTPWCVHGAHVPEPSVWDKFPFQIITLLWGNGSHHS